MRLYVCVDMSIRRYTHMKFNLFAEIFKNIFERAIRLKNCVSVARREPAQVCASPAFRSSS